MKNNLFSSTQLSKRKIISKTVALTKVFAAKWRMPCVRAGLARKSFFRGLHNTADNLATWHELRVGDREVYVVPESVVSHIISDYSSLGKCTLQGMFLCFSDGYWVACDNSDGYAWTEDFKSKQDAIRWLLYGDLCESDFS